MVIKTRHPKPPRTFFTSGQSHHTYLLTPDTQSYIYNTDEYRTSQASKVVYIHKYMGGPSDARESNSEERERERERGIL
jgi:hypothetical protein